MMKTFRTRNMLDTMLLNIQLKQEREKHSGDTNVRKNNEKIGTVYRPTRKYKSISDHSSPATEKSEDTKLRQRLGKQCHNVK